MKAREPRRNVLIRARMRIGASWRDVSILNISSRGLMIHSAQPPSQGAYLEVWRGRHAIIARVVWAREQRFGVRTQDPLSVEAIVREPDKSAPDARRSQEAPVERRQTGSRARSSKERHEHSRMFGRAFEFAFVAIGGLFAALAVYGVVVESLSDPLAEVSGALTAR